MSLLDTFFLRYKADTGQAVKDVDKLDAAEQKREKNKKRTEQADEKQHKSGRRRSKETIDDTKKASKAQEELKKVGKDTFDNLAASSGRFGTVLAKLGPIGIAAAAAVAAVAAGVSVAFAGISDARAAAEEAEALRANAYSGRLAQGELIRLQNRGRAIGVTDEETSQSAQSVYQRGSEIRAAQRQAARDPASAFNNPLIKMGNLMKKAGVDVGASMEVQIEQQDKYLRGLVERGEKERALVEGVELFGRVLSDVHAVISTTADQAAVSALQMAEENNRRRELQVASESLSASENKLEAERKKNDERIRSHTVPATEEFTKSLTEWEKATGPLKDSWGEFVASMINGLAGIVSAAQDFLEFTGLIEENTNGLSRKEVNNRKAVDEAGEAARIVKQQELQRRVGPRGSLSAEDKAAIDKAEMDARVAKMKALKASEPAEAAGVRAAVTVAKGYSELNAEGRAALAQAVMDDPGLDLQRAANELLENQNAILSESGQVQKAQTELTRKIEANTAPLVNTSLEQAMALWAGSAGKGAGMESGAFRGEDRISYESRIKGLKRTINPNLVYQVDEDRAALGAASRQASDVNKMSLSSGSSSSGKGDVQINGGVNVTVNSKAADAAGIAHDTAYSIKDELAYVVGEMSSPVIS